MMKQTPSSEEFLLKWKGDVLTVTLTLDSPRKGRAALRTNLGRAQVRRREIIAETERGEVPLARAWTDVPMAETEPGVFRADIRLDEVGVFSGKACFFPEGSSVPEWPDGQNFHVKVEPDDLRKNCSIYTVFPRQFGSFREVARRLPLIMDRMGFKIIQTLPPFPVPTTYAVMGEYGCPFAATDFYSVDPAMAEFDEFATPLDQFRELIDCVHARRGLFFVDLPANHTGWASTLQTHHPEWFTREADGRFHSPGAWGVKWADLVELDYSNAELRSYMADVFLFWCRNGVDGFRCDAGYMIPADTWKYIVARVREEYPDTVFMLEGLGGELSVTDSLLSDSNLDWAYSEIFQTYDRGQFEWYLPGAIARSEKYGTLVHFAETHDNDRLAKGGETYARLRVQLAALLSWQGAWGIANGVEWFCKEKIDVHGKNDLNWDAPENMVNLIAQLNRTLDTHPTFRGSCRLELITRGEGNTLAVKRTGEDGSTALVVANLDCHNPAEVDWDHSQFVAKAAEKSAAVRGGKKTRTNGPIALEPGEVRLLDGRSGVPAAPVAEAEEASGRDGEEALFHLSYPRNMKRVAVVPEEQSVEISAPYHFRVDVVSQFDGKTIRGGRSDEIRRNVHAFRFLAPHYHGDGTHCRELLVKVTVYEPGRPRRIVSRLLIPPKSRDARVRLGMSPEELRAFPCNRAILSNGAGAAAQVRAGWGEIASQYDALLAANPNPDVPSDRVNVWARTRCWLQREGYMRQLDNRCEFAFNADPGGKGVEWHFRVPCGMGKSASFNFELTLAEGSNLARLRVTRYAVKDEEDVGDQVRLVFRPDVEWRSYHSTTKAYLDGTEKLFHESCRETADGAEFSPYDGKFLLHVRNGVYHHEPQWEYNVAHAEEAARGQDGSGDLFSPGWISADLKPGESMDIVGEFLTASDAASPDPFGCRWGIDNFPTVSTLSFGEAMRRAIELYIVKRDDLKTVIAGYPWFLDWGRDTFIFMRGMIAAGRVADALKILKAFAAFEENGTLPNIIYGKTAGNRDTTDAQLWFIRCVQELELKGEVEVEDKTVNSALQLQLGTSTALSELKETCNSIVDNYIKGTPNGIRMDPDSGLVWSPSHFTWMDTNYPACTPREGYPVEIQALWISALKFLGRDELAAKALESVKKYFKHGPSSAGSSASSTESATPDCNCGYADCLDALRGVPAAKARPDFAVRPNQLFLVALGILDDPSILRATEGLLVPGGMRSLNCEHPLYRGVYAGDENTSRKPAYHNGTVWAWPFPLYAEAMAMTGACSKETALQLLASAVENINAGCLGHLSEIADGDAPHAQKGCTAQAWSDSEVLRVWLKLGGK